MRSPDEPDPPQRGALPGPRERTAHLALTVLLGGDGARWLVDRVRERVASGRAVRDAMLTGVVARQRPTGAEREAVLRLVGPPRRPGGVLRVDLGDVEAVLRRGPWAAGLVDAVETLTGPIVVRGELRAQSERAWVAVAAAMDPAIAAHPGIAGWWARFCADGGHKRLGDGEGMTERAAAARHTVDRAATVLSALPLEPPGEPLAVLARRLLGDAHGLDADRRLGRLVVAAIRGGRIGDGDARVGGASAGLRSSGPVGSGLVGSDVGGGAGEVMADRDVWGTVGVVASAVTSTVLCLGVRGDAAADPCEPPSLEIATATSLEAMAGASAPVVLTLDQARSRAVRPVPAHGRVYVVENPTVIEAIAAGWTAHPPGPDMLDLLPAVVCTNGQPTLAVVDLITRLAADGATVHYHGDFDWPGLRIATALARSVPWTPWRFTAADYEAATARDLPARPLTGAPTESPWDPALAIAMATRGVVIEEEAVIEELVGDVLSAPSHIAALSSATGSGRFR